jgi:dolichyl-phosphate-mannose--protein O-mannosyl transferase
MRASEFVVPVGEAGRAEDTQGRGLRDRLVPPMPPASIWGWAGPLLVTLFGGFLRFYHLGTPKAVVFDETYYVPDAWSILHHGVEWSHPKNVNSLLVNGSTHVLTTPGEYVAHPPLGKAMIAVGEWMFGLTPFGWRFSAALVGTLAILLIARIVRRMTRSNLLGCVAGLLMALDGLEFVLSRVAILDIFVMFWVLAAFGMLVLDRDASRARLAALTDLAPASELAGGGPNLGIRWRRVLAGVFLGAACATKWNGVWYLFAFAALAIAWDIGARRALGYRDRLLGVLRSDVIWMPVSFGAVPFLTYLVSWSGWFISDGGYGRNWAATAGNHIPIWSTLDSWYQYQKSMLGFGLGLEDHSGYVSYPWTWIILGRPVSMFSNCLPANHCGSGPGSTEQEVLAIGTPAIWWASILALVFCVVWYIARRDWRAGGLLVGVAAGWLPWFFFAWHNHRTEYYFYAIIFLPFLIIALTLCLGLIIGPAAAPAGRRATGALVAGGYMLLTLASFAYLYPVLAAQVIPYSSWFSRMWFHSWI